MVVPAAAFVFSIILVVQPGLGLYEDQAFKFDWHLRTIDAIVHGGFVLNGKRFVAATLSHVLACLDSQTGKLLWRQVLEPEGSLIDFRIVEGDEDAKVDSLSRLSPLENGKFLFRRWNVLNGALLFERLIVSGSNEETGFLCDECVCSLDKKGELFKRCSDGTSTFSLSETALQWIATEHFLVVLNDKDVLYTLDLRRPDQGLQIQNELKGKKSILFKVGTNAVCVSDENSKQYLKVGKDGILSEELSIPVAESEWVTFDREMIRVKQKNSEIECIKKDSSFSIVVKEDRGPPIHAWTSGENVILRFEDGATVSRFWSREDGLARIEKVSLIPFISEVDDDNKAEEKMDAVLHQFARRFKRHMNMIQSKFSNLFQREVVYDFGFQKIIVAVTAYGKIYAIDSNSGKILWQFKFSIKSESVMLFLQRAERHPVCTLIFWEHGHHLLTFNPITGRMITSRRKVSEHKLDQAILLHYQLPDGTHPIMMVTKNQIVALEPEDSNPEFVSEIQKKNMYLLTVQDANRLEGNRIEIRGGHAKLTPTWSITLSSFKISKIVSKHLDNRVHSQGRVMADRSVLFKYVNPNLVAVLAESADLTSITILLLDMVTGRILFSVSHKRVTGPYCLVHSENWIVYSYYNEKARRTELGSLELFEGNTQTNTTVFSSFQNNRSPLVERQSYILGGFHIMNMVDTVTEKGITSKHILIATNQGVIYNVPRTLLDPRRPNANTPPEMREPGLIPYIPELHLSPEMILNYNRTILGPRGLATTHTGLESTSIVFIYGLDLYCTQVTPSRGFDLLKDDFDYYVISTVLMGLVVAAYVTRKLAQSKNVKQAWK